MEKIDILSLNENELCAFIESIGEKKFRGKQIFKWLHQKHSEDFLNMTDISEAFRNKLKEICCINSVKKIDCLESKADGTRKYLFETKTGNIIESVLMKYSYGNAVCISSQAGCRMGCSFCASTINGLERNLTSGEMLSQIYEISKDIGEKINHIVIMGSGEPMDNYDNVIKFLDIVNSDSGINISHRHITVSTCGIIEGIEKLKNEKLQITLAISLHAPNDEIRKKIMPVANKYGIDSLIKCATDYANSTKRRVTFEYALISGVNDSDENALELADRLKGKLVHINLIPVNDVSENNFVKSNEKRIKKFADILSKKHIEVTIRRELGSDINAACGQLRASVIKKMNR